MHITDARHFLDDKGAIAARSGPAKVMADFNAALIAYATDYLDTGVPAAACFQCKPVEVLVTRGLDDAICWFCPQCKSKGRVSNWQGTLWDLSDSPDALS
jgi:hypothetical protein